MLKYKDNFARHKSIKSNLIHGTDSLVGVAVSIVIPTHGRPNLITEAINSALHQKFELPYEVIIIDNGSNSYDLSQLKEFIRGLDSKILYLYANEKNIGMIGNWNRCIEIARSDWLIILHDDDVMHPLLLDQLWKNRLGTALVSSSTFTFSDSAEIKYVGCSENIGFEENRHPRRVGVKRLNVVDVLKDVPITASGTLLHKETCISLGGYDLDLWPHFDYLFSARYIVKFGGVLIREKLLYYRLLQNSSSLPEVYIKFHRAKYSVRKSIVATMIVSGSIRILILKMISRLKWLDLYSELARYSNEVSQINARLDRYVKIFPKPSILKRIKHKLERIIYPINLSCLYCFHGLLSMFKFKKFSSNYLNTADWVSNEE